MMGAATLALAMLLAGCGGSSSSSEGTDSTISPRVLTRLCAEMVTDWTADEYGEGRYRDAKRWCSEYVRFLSDANS